MHKLLLSLVVVMCVAAYCNAQHMPPRPTLPKFRGGYPSIWRPQKRLQAHNWRLCWGGSCWMCVSLRSYCLQHNYFCQEFVQLCTAYTYFYGPYFPSPYGSGSGRKVPTFGKKTPTVRRKTVGTKTPKLSPSLATKFSSKNLPKISG